MDKLKELAEKVKEVRDLQKEYFKNKHKSILEKCRLLEKELDLMIESVLFETGIHLNFSTLN